MCLQVKAASFLPYKQSDFVSCKPSDFDSNPARIDDVTAAFADLSPASNAHSISTSVWPAVNERAAAYKLNHSVPVKECSACEAALMRCFANNFVVMNLEDLQGLQIQDLEIIL